MQPVDQIFSALGNPVRRKILYLLKEEPMSVGAIANYFTTSRPAVSKHLKILQEAGLVGYNERGTKNIFSLNPSGFQDIKAYLEPFWDEALANYKNLVENLPEE